MSSFFGSTKTSALGSLFGSGGGDAEDEDPLVYKRQADPLSAKPAPAPTPAPSSAPAPSATTTSTASAAQYIMTSSVGAVYLYNTSTRGYDAKSGSGPVGCVIVGQGVNYSIMFYGQDKMTILKEPITSTVSFHYFNCLFISIYNQLFSFPFFYLPTTNVDIFPSFPSFPFFFNSILFYINS